MSNAIISYPDNTMSALLSGGSWQATAPLTNLKNTLLSCVARSTNALATSSIIQVDLVNALNIRVISLIAHNISKDGTVRARGYSDSGYTTMVSGADTGTVRLWPVGFTATDVANYPKTWTYCFSSYKTARYWKIEITDTTNSMGYIELGRCWMGEATFEPAVGVSYGAGLGYTSRDVIEESIGGILWGEKRVPRRSLTAVFEMLTPAERRKALLIQKLLTETTEAFWITNSLATQDDLLFEAFPCYLRQPSPLTYPYISVYQMNIEVMEKI